ncbi:MAG TPA: RodZ domain-containing protein [Sphingomicrobium sp.]|nr:RodZ domain-containing protein [Sphingomicrobium sp.]
MEEFDEPLAPSAGEQLRTAREAKGLSLEEIAAQTRIPRRHLESLEQSDWSKLPAPTYTIGFAKSFATAVGIDRTEIGDKLREEMGGTRPEYSPASEVFEPADPARTMPKWLVLSAIAGIILVVLLMTWLNNRSLEQPAGAPEAVANEQAAVPQPQPQAATAAQGPVVLTAIEPVWLSVYEPGGAKLFEGVLNAGQDFQVPSTATAPLLRTGKPEALRISVGGQAAPVVGPPATTVRDVSLLPADLMRGPQQGQAPPPTAGRARPGATNQAPPAASPPPLPENPTNTVTNGASGQ